MYLQRNTSETNMQCKNSKHPFNLYLNAGEYVKAIGSQDGHFPDFGHHLANEMGGIWLHPIKLLDGFWLRVTDIDRKISVWSRADEFVNHPWGSEFHYDHGLSHIPVSIKRTQFAPEMEKGLVVGYEIHNYADRPTRLKLELLARTDLRPVWFSDSIGIHDGDSDQAERITDRLTLVKDSGNEWYALIGTDLPGTVYETGQGLYGPEFTSGNGIGVKYETEVTIGGGEHFPFHLFIAGSYTSRQECERTYEIISRDHDRLLEEKKREYENIRGLADLQIDGEEHLNDLFAWVKWNTQWLVQRVDGIGRGLTAGSPTYPWWFGCDNSYSLQGVLAIGDHQLAKDTSELLLRKSKEVNGNGRIIHEVTTMGAVSNPGNTQETAHYITMIWELYRWTGDRGVIEQNYEYCLKGIEWLLGEMDPDGDLLPSGYGIIEIAGLNMELIDSAVYTAKALQAAAHMSLEMIDEAKAAELGMLRKRLIEQVNNKYWIESEGLYADAVAPKKDILPKVDQLVYLADRAGIPGYRQALEQMLGDVTDENEDHGWLINKNWVISTPMEAGIADPEKGKLAIRNMRNRDFIGEYGSYLSANFKQGTMSISTGVHAVAEALYGTADDSLDLINRINRSFSMVLPGSINEISPDYGCFVQAWTVYAIAVPLIGHYIGLKPEAHQGKVLIQPNLPSSWDGKWVRLSNARVGDGMMDIALSAESGKLQVRINNRTGYEVTVSWKGQTVRSTDAELDTELVHP